MAPPKPLPMTRTSVCSVLVMPGFAKRLNDTETAALATFLRQAWSNTAPAVSEGDVEHVRAKLHK